MPPLESLLQTRDGITLTAERHPRPDRRAVVTVLHGYAEHAGRYSGLVAALDAAGYECNLLNLRGHGRSGGVRGYVRRFGDYLDDLDLFLARTGERLPAAPRVLLGHSLGGLVSLAYVLRRPQAFDALAVSSPFLHPTQKVPPLEAALAAVVSFLRPTYLMQSGIDSRWLSHDPAVADAYDRDPLVFKTLSPRWFFEVRRAQREVRERAGEIRLPVLFLLGGADPIADPERSREVFARLGSADKRLTVYPGLFHEVFNEIEREQVTRDLLAWLNERALGLPAVPPPAR